eukprot:sb/3479257/
MQSAVDSLEFHETELGWQGFAVQNLVPEGICTMICHYSQHTTDYPFTTQFCYRNLKSILFFPCPGGCSKGIHPDDHFSTCAKKIIKGLEFSDLK